MTAVVRPVCIDHADLSDCGIALLCKEVLLAECDIINIHCKAVRLDKITKSVTVKLCEAVESCNLCGDLILDSKSFGLLESCLSCLYGVDYVLLDLCDILLSKAAVESIYLSRTNERTLALGDDLNALCCRVCSLIELTGKELYCKNVCAIECGLIAYCIELRLGENCLLRIIEEAFLDILCVVSVNNANVCKRFDAEKCSRIVKKRLCLMGKLFFLFYKNSVNHKNLAVMP